DWASQNWQDWAGWRPRPGGRGWPGPPGFDVGMFRDLERLAVDFARDLRKAAWDTESIGENALGDLRSILEDALTRIQDDGFGGAKGRADQRRGDSTPAPEDRRSKDTERNDAPDS